MTTRRLWVEQHIDEGRTLTLHGPEAHYIGRVLRCRRGDELTLFNGATREYPARIERIDKSGVTLAVGAGLEACVESPLDIRLIQCLSRGERMDTVVQKASELGVRRLSPVEGEFSVVHLDDERADKRLRHWRRISQSACEQCGRTVPPVLDKPRRLAAALSAPATDGLTRLMLQPGGARSFDAIERPARLELLIGPEGGLSGTERELAQAAGFVPVSLGPRTLRTETAAIAAVTLSQALWGDLFSATDP